MADIKTLFGGGKKQMQNMNTPGGVNIKVDINTLDDIPCIKCGEKEFTTITRLKKLSRTISPNGQEGVVNVNMLKCLKCGWAFNAQEYEQHQKEQVDTPEIEVSEVMKVKENWDTKIIKKTDDKEYVNKELCRTCGRYFDKGSNHNCDLIA